MERETLRLTAKQDAEKIELLAEVKKLISIPKNLIVPNFCAGEGSVRPTGSKCDRADAEEQQ